ncbi:MAG: DUF262 domain-containing protein [Muribaculaceae bacterium]|nr:DUF262 domain-containing protein [Muribaculaceae bacterium]
MNPDIANKENKKETLINLKKYLALCEEGKSFKIPDYQRGYIWGKKPEKQEKYETDAVTKMCDTLLEAYFHMKEKGNSDINSEIFLQGITYYIDKENNVVLVDGQQRTTFFYILLKFLEYQNHFKIKYDIREDSDTFLPQIRIEDKEDGKEEAQDIFFFKRTMRIIGEKLNGINKKEFLEFILENVQFLSVKVEPKDSTLVFTMMNGNRAKMKDSELIKSELLRSSSITKEGNLITESENQEIRSRLAREWDKWLRWWNREDVKIFFNTKEQLGWLLPLWLESEKISFEKFKELHKIDTVKDSKLAFLNLRLLQKRLEDAFYDPQVYNLIGFILLKSNEKFEFLKWYFETLKDLEIDSRLKYLRVYFDAVLIGMSHSDIIDEIKFEHQEGLFSDKWKEKALEFLESLSSETAYNTNNQRNIEFWLLRRNILEDNTQGEQKLGRKFDFDIWRKISLEHIMPKSWFVPANSLVKKENQYFNSEIPAVSIPLYGWIKKPTEHSIGNLVLIYMNENSSFGANDFEEKKKIFFSNTKDGFKSRHLLHSVMAFANSEWNLIKIAQQYMEEINLFSQQFGLGNSIAKIDL